MTEQSKALGTPVDLVLGLVDRLRQRGYDLRSHPVANGTIDCTEAAGELMIEAAAEIERLRWDLGELRGRIAQMERDEGKALAAERKAAANECLSILLDGRYWNGAPQIAHEGASDRAAEIRRVFGL